MMDYERGYVVALNTTTGDAKWNRAGVDNSFYDDKGGPSLFPANVWFLSFALARSGDVYATGVSVATEPAGTGVPLYAIRDCSLCDAPRPLWRHLEQDSAVETGGLGSVSLSSPAAVAILATANTGARPPANAQLGGRLVQVPLATPDVDPKPFDGGLGSALPEPPGVIISKSPADLGIAVAWGGLHDVLLGRAGQAMVVATRGRDRSQNPGSRTTPFVFGVSENLGDALWTYPIPEVAVSSELEWGGRVVPSPSGVLVFGDRQCTKSAIVSPCENGLSPSARVFAIRVR